MTPNKLLERTISGTLGGDELDYSELSSVFRDSQAMLRSALEQDPENAELKSLLDQSKQMEALLTASGQAEQAGDMDRLSEIASEISELTGTGQAPEVLEGDIGALEEAIEDGDILAAKRVIDQGVELNACYGEYDQFPLGWAVTSENRSVEMVRLLLQHGADAAFATPEGYTALHDIANYMWGVDDRNLATELTRILVTAGADIEARNHYGWTPLLRAVMEGSADEMRAMLSNGADPNAIYPNHSMPEFSRGMTALINATHDPEKVALLLAYGADPSAVAPNGQDFVAYVTKEIEHVTTTREPFFVKMLLRLLGVKAMKQNMIKGLEQSRDLVAEALRT